MNHNDKKNLALFDLDHTLLDIDSDYTWGEFIVKRGFVDEVAYRSANQKFYDQYIEGTLDATEYNEFVAKFLTSLPLEDLYKIRQEFIETEIVPFIRPLAVEKIVQHRDNDDEIVIISATNDFVVSAIAELFAVPAANVIATQLQINNNCYTGKLVDRPNFQEGKLYHLNNWLKNKNSQGLEYQKSYAYSDSKNDLPLLGWADVAICVSPDKTLENIAVTRSWQIKDWSI